MHILDLESIAPKEKIDSAFDVLYRVNVQASPYCTPNLVNENGKIWELSVQSYSSWPRLVFGLAGYRVQGGRQKMAGRRKERVGQSGAAGKCVEPALENGRENQRRDPEVYYLDHYIGSAAPSIFTI